MDKRADDLPDRAGLADDADAPYEKRETALLRVIERQILPRLLVRQPDPVLRDRFGDGLSEHIPALADLALRADDSRAMDMLHRLHGKGLSFSQLQLGLLAPTARRLDRLWKSDRATFVDVTEATGTLKRLMRFVALDLSPRHQLRYRYKTILVAPAPGDDHNFGAAMAAEYYRRDGWSVRHEPAATGDLLAQRVGAEWFDVVALSLTARESAAGLRSCTRLIRTASLNPRILILVGGEAVARLPSLAEAVGADAAIAPVTAAPARTFRLVTALYGVQG